MKPSGNNFRDLFSGCHRSRYSETCVRLIRAVRTCLQSTGDLWHPENSATPIRKIPANRCLRLLLVCAVASLASAGCKQRASFADPPSYEKPEQPTQFFADGTSARPLVAGVVPRPMDQSPGIPYVVVKGTGPIDAFESAPSEKIPFAVTPAVLRRGQERFNIYCAPCHGRTGNGDGVIVERGFTRPPSFYSPALLAAPDSHFFNVITNGKGAMFSYNERVAPDDRWAIVAYIRAMQMSSARSPAQTQPATQGGTR